MNLNAIKEMQIILEKIKTSIVFMNSNIDAIKQSIDKDEFIDSEVNDNLRQQLNEIDAMQKELFNKYKQFGDGVIPVRISEARDDLVEIFQNAEGRQEYVELKRFVLRMYSEIRNIEKLLETERKIVSAFNTEKIDIDELKATMEKYVLLKNLYCEEDIAKKYSYSFDIRKDNLFDKELVMAVILGNVLLRNQPVDENISAVISDTATVHDKNVKDDAVEEDTPEIEPIAEEDSCNTSDAPADDIILETDDDWVSIGVHNAEDIVHKEDISKLTVKQSPKAMKAFGAKEFKKELAASDYTAACKRMILTLAYKDCVHTELLAKLAKEDVNLFKKAEAKLLNHGYIKEYKVEGYDPFLCLTPKGDKIFASKEAVSYLNTITQKNYKVDKGPVENIEDTTNSAIVRAISLYANYFAHKYKFKEEDEIVFNISDDWSIYSYDTVSNVILCTIVSENFSAFKSFIDELETFIDDSKENNIVITGIGREHSKALCEWLKDYFGSDNERTINVMYGMYGIDEVYGYGTDSPVSYKVFSEIASPDESGEECVDEYETAVEDTIVKEEKKIYSETPKERAVLLTEDDNNSDTKDNEENQEQERSEERKNESVTAEISFISDEPEAVTDYSSEFQTMISADKIYAAAAYIKALSAGDKKYSKLCTQFAYAVNEPMEKCSYNSDTVYNVFFNSENIADVSDYLLVSAVLRNYFMDDFVHDYSLQSLQDMMNENKLLSDVPELKELAYKLYEYKKNNHTGVNRYADYRKKEIAYGKEKLKNIRHAAQECFDKYCSDQVKEKSSHPRYRETKKLLLGRNSDLCLWIEEIISDSLDKEYFEELKAFVKDSYIKESATIKAENIDFHKVNKVINEKWMEAEQFVKLVKKSSVLVSGLYSNLVSSVTKTVTVLCDYINAKEAFEVDESDKAYISYRKIRDNLVDIINNAINIVSSHKNEYARVLVYTLRELSSRLDGSYEEGSYKFFYVDFLKTAHVLLDENYYPVFNEVHYLPRFNLAARIAAHSKTADRSFNDRLEEIIDEGDPDYGSAKLIIKYMEETKQPVEVDYGDIELDILDAKDRASRRKSDFIGDIELYQSYGQITDSFTSKHAAYYRQEEKNDEDADVKETILHVVDFWFDRAEQDNNYSFFFRILQQFRDEIKITSNRLAKKHNEILAEYIRSNPDKVKEDTIAETISQIRARIAVQNYTAAEDLMNRLASGDIHDYRLEQKNYFDEFLKRFDGHYRNVSSSRQSLTDQIRIFGENKDAKGGRNIVRTWIKNNMKEEDMVNFMSALGFKVDSVVKTTPIDNIPSYKIKLKSPPDGRKDHYAHPIAPFGSLAEGKGFRIVCLFGKEDAERLAEKFDKIGDDMDTLVLLDYALTLGERRKLARLAKVKHSDKIFAVVDKVVISYLAKNYGDGDTVKKLMAVIMPFASYQPYIHKSADIMPQEIFTGRKDELQKIKSPTGVNIVFGGRQLGKSALLRMAKKEINHNENGDRAIIVDIRNCDYKEAAKRVSEALFDEKVLKEEHITTDWNELARSIRKRLSDKQGYIPYFLMMLDEADKFIESCKEVDYKPIDALKDIQLIGEQRFKFVLAGLRNVIRFNREASLSNNSNIAHLSSLTVKPFRYSEARELMEVPMSYLGFKFEDNEKTESLLSTIFGTTNYFPGIIQLYCAKLIEAMKHDYAGYSESDTPPYILSEDHIKKVLAQENVQDDIRDKFYITLKVGDDDYYYILALIIAFNYYVNKESNGCSAQEILSIAKSYEIDKIGSMSTESISALLEELRDLNILQLVSVNESGEKQYRFARYNFYQMMGNKDEVEEELMKYMG